MPRPRTRRPSAARAARPPRQGAARRGAPARGSARGTRLGRERRTHRRRRRGAPGVLTAAAPRGGAHVSGIAGLWHLDGRPGEPAELDGMLARLAHRGPDGTGAWREGRVALGHGMLHTTPESLREQQPLVGTRGDLVLVADARVDNRPRARGRPSSRPAAAVPPVTPAWYAEIGRAPPELQARL